MSLKLVREIIRNHLLAEQGLSFTSDDFKDVYATARMAHMGQKRRGGEEYFSHPSEVRNIVRRFYPKDYISQMAALLHDSLEDAPGLTVDSVEEMEGFIRGSISNPEVGDEVLRVVKSVTHEKGGNYSSYVLSLLGNEKALRVKLADMIHNLSDSPSTRQKEKYRKALDLLSSETNGINPPGISEKHWKKLYSLTESKRMKVKKNQLRRIIREAINEDRASRLNIVFDVMGDTPQFKIQQSGYVYDLTEYSREDFESFVQEFETDHSAPMPEHQAVHDSYGIGFPDGVLFLREAWDFVFDILEDM